MPRLGTHELGITALEQDEWRQALVCAALIRRLGVPSVAISLEELTALKQDTLVVEEDVYNQEIILRLR